MKSKKQNKNRTISKNVGKTLSFQTHFQFYKLLEKKKLTFENEKIGEREKDSKNHSVFEKLAVGEKWHMLRSIIYKKRIIS